MYAPTNSLRPLVDKWLDLSRATRVHVTPLRLASSNSRYVRVEVQHSEDAAAMFFFWHGNGQWCVFPPQSRRPMLNPQGSGANGASESVTVSD